MKNTSAIDYCANLVRQQDYPHFLAGLMMPHTVRPALWSLYAFYVEISKTPQVVSDTTIGLIRLQWWHESIDRLYQGKPDAHEVIRALELALQSGVAWKQNDFDVLIDLIKPSLYKDGTFSVDAIQDQLLMMSLAVIGERSANKMRRIFGYLKKNPQPDSLLPWHLWLAAVLFRR